MHKNPIHVFSFPFPYSCYYRQHIWLWIPSQPAFFGRVAGGKPPFVLWISSHVLPNHTKQISLCAIHSGCKSDWFTGTGHFGFRNTAATGRMESVNCSTGRPWVWVAPACRSWLGSGVTAVRWNLWRFKFVLMLMFLGKRKILLQ